MQKKQGKIRRFWYADMLVMPMPVGIITTVNERGVVNAAPYSLITPYDVSPTRPQMLVSLRRRSHTFKNILATQEFVINFPTARHLEEVNELFRFYPEGINELEYTSLSPIKSFKVKPPSIKECPQHIECRLSESVDVNRNQGRIIGDIVAIVMDEDLFDLDRGAKIEKMNLPVYMGDEMRKLFYYAGVDKTRKFELDPRPKTEGDRKATTTLPWDDAALAGLSKVPDFVKQLVIDRLEDAAKQEGIDRVTYDGFLVLLKEYAPPDLIERFSS